MATDDLLARLDAVADSAYDEVDVHTVAADAAARLRALSERPIAEPLIDRIVHAIKASDDRCKRNAYGNRRFREDVTSIVAALAYISQHADADADDA